MSGLDELSREELIALVQELYSANVALTARVSALEKEVAELRSQLPRGTFWLLTPEWALWYNQLRKWH